MASDLEETGNHIFSQLVWRSFFHDVETTWSWGKKNFGYRDVTTCKVHDLMHDLAVDISGNECLCLHKLSEINRIQQDVRHLASPHPHKIGFILQHCRIIRTVFSLYKHPTGSAQYLNNIINSTLRVLGLQIYGIKAFSFEPAFMKHLRYLDFSCCPIEAVPEVTSALYNLQVLVLNNCSRLNQPPEGTKYMVNLRHVYLDGCHNLKCMPADLGQLSLLRTLTKYVVGNDPGRGIKELRNLKLGGRLHIYDLRKVNNALDAKEADLETNNILRI
uniref:Disease resistance protein winged helix domain-containing protein n=1 Tax=Arundo donax TaxID=35708 RepID=A0A0A9FDW4_ARUDO